MKKCKNCKERFKPRFSTLEKYCWKPDCKTIEAMDKLEKKKKADSKAWRKEKKVRKEKLKTRTDYLKDAQKVFNQYIRLRDKDKPCISCLKPKGTEQAGHYRSVGGNPELRFNEINCFGQCIHCNMHLHGNLIEYRKGLIDRIGESKVDWLESNHEPEKLTVDEIKLLIKKYKNKIKSLAD